jgi:hypothetical protein
VPAVDDEDEAMLDRLRLPETPSRKPRGRSGYVLMTTEAARAGFLALKCPQAIVWHYIHYRVWADGQPTVPLPNQTLASLGVTRWVKQRALRNLERAGLVRVAYRGRKSPLVTLLTQPR